MQSIEATRGIAAMMVLLMHAANLMSVEHFSGHVGMGGIFSFGYVGVDFFFTLSGFIIAFVHFNDIGRPDRLVAYIRKRLTRIYPIYWFCLALTIGVLITGRMFLNKNTPLGFCNDDVAGTIFLLPLSLPKFVEVAWSLQFEVMFYGTFAFLLLNRRMGIFLFITWFLAILWRLLVNSDISSFGGLLTAYSLQFLLGVATGVTARRQRLSWANWPLLLFGIFCFIASVYYERSLAAELHGPLGQFLLGLSSSIILLSLVEMEKRKQIHTPYLMYRMGTVSYSIYLSHIVFLNLAYSVLLKTGFYHRLPETLTYFVAVIIAVTCSAFIGVLIELPLGRFFKHTLARSRPAAQHISHIPS